MLAEAGTERREGKDTLGGPGSGRLRLFPNQKDGYTERLNTPIQGTGADGLKRAMVILHPQLATMGASILLAVHD